MHFTANYEITSLSPIFQPIFMCKYNFFTVHDNAHLEATYKINIKRSYDAKSIRSTYLST